MADLAQQIQLVPPSLPLRETQTTYHGVSRTEPGPEILQNLAEQRAVEQEQANVIARDTEHQQKVATAESALEQERADEMGRQLQARARVEEQVGKDIDSWKKNLNEAYTAAIRAPAPSLFRGGASTSENVLRAFGLFMMGVSDAGTNAIAVQQGRAPGSHQLHDFIAADLAAQRQNIEQLKDNVVMSRTGLRDAQEAREQMLAQVDARGAAIYKRLEALARARLSAMKVDQKAIEGDARVQALAAEGVKQRQNSVAGLTRKIEEPSKSITVRDPSPTASRPTEGQQNLALIGQNIKDDLAVLQNSPPVPQDVLAKYQQQGLDMEAANASATSGLVGNLATRAGRSVGLVPKSAMEGVPPEHQKSLLATTRISREMIKRMTGAGMSLAEATTLTAIYAPQPGDTKEVIAEKMAAAEAQANQALALAGPAAAAAVQGTARRASPNLVGKGPSAKDPTASDKAAAPEDINSEAPLPEDPQAQSIDELQGKAPAVKAAVPTAKPEILKPDAIIPPQESRRDKAIRMLRANPSAKGAQTIRRLYNITDEELRGGN
jgi:hypothetical protein